MHGEENYKITLHFSIMFIYNKNIIIIYCPSIYFSILLTIYTWKTQIFYILNLFYPLNFFYPSTIHMVFKGKNIYGWHH